MSASQYHVYCGVYWIELGLVISRCLGCVEKLMKLLHTEDHTLMKILHVNLCKYFLTSVLLI